MLRFSAEAECERTKPAENVAKRPSLYLPLMYWIRPKNKVDQGVYR